MADSNQEISKLYAILKKEMDEKHGETLRQMAEVSKTVNSQAAFLAGILAKVGELMSTLQTLSTGGNELGAELQTVSQLALGQAPAAAAAAAGRKAAKKVAAEDQIVSVLSAFRQAAAAAADGAGSSDGAEGAGAALAEFYASDLFKQFMEFLLATNKMTFIKCYVQIELVGLGLPWHLMDGVEPVSILALATGGPAVPVDRVVDKDGNVTFQKPADPSAVDYWLFASGEPERHRHVVGGGEGFVNPECEKPAFLKQKKSDIARAFNVGFKLSKMLTAEQKTQIESHQKQLKAEWLKVAREPLTQADAAGASA